MGENGGVLPLLRVPHHNTPMYVQLLSFGAFLRGYYEFRWDAKRVIYARKRVYLLVS